MSRKYSSLLDLGTLLANCLIYVYFLFIILKNTFCSIHKKYSTPKSNNEQEQLLNSTTSDTHALTLILHQAVPGAESTKTKQTSSTRPGIVASDGPQPPQSPRRRHHAIDSSIGAARKEPSFWTASDFL